MKGVRSGNTHKTKTTCTRLARLETKVRSGNTHRRWLMALQRFVAMEMVTVERDIIGYGAMPDFTRHHWTWQTNGNAETDIDSNTATFARPRKGNQCLTPSGAISACKRRGMWQLTLASLDTRTSANCYNTAIRARGKKGACGNMHWHR